jgi:hypothetical protein
VWQAPGFISLSELTLLEFSEFAAKLTATVIAITTPILEMVFI